MTSGPAAGCAGLSDNPLFVTRRSTPLSPDALERRIARYAATARVRADDGQARGGPPVRRQPVADGQLGQASSAGLVDQGGTCRACEPGCGAGENMACQAIDPDNPVPPGGKACPARRSHYRARRVR
jgi:hypothetical protein